MTSTLHLIHTKSMKRFALDYLQEWKQRHNRKPLVIRGARQVGKTELVRIFAQSEFEGFVEINFDQSPSKASLFLSDNISEIIRFIEVDLNTRIIPGKTLLFLDEIQAAPAILAKLRYFYEKLPQLHIICAGSLLEFTLGALQFSMPVGRVEYLFLGPMSFEEFLLAMGQNQLYDFLSTYKLPQLFPESIHLQLITRLREYSIIGGMPGVLKNHLESGRDFQIAAMEHKSIIQTYYEDFAKYQNKVDVSLLQRLYRKIPGMLGQSIKFTNLDHEEKSMRIRICLDLLEKAHLIYRVFHSDGNGIPLGAEQNERHFKIVFLDIGLAHSFLGLKVSDLAMADDFTLINSGASAEQFIGQQFLYRRKFYEKPELYYWNRMKNGATSELDYLIENGQKVLPVEVKAGKTGRLKSLQVFVHDKGVNLGVRFNSATPTLMDVVTSIAGKEKKQFKLLSLPLYMVEELPRILDEMG